MLCGYKLILYVTVEECLLSFPSLPPSLHLLFLAGAIAIARAHFGQGTGPIYLDNLECTGMESRLVQCTHQGVGSHNCGHLEDAGVFCQREILRIYLQANFLTCELSCCLIGLH